MKKTVTDDRRRYSRIAFNAGGRLSLAGRDIEGHVLDLSLKGALVHIRGEVRGLDVGVACALHVDLDELGGQIRMQGTITHVAGQQLGLTCRAIDIDSATHLRRLVELNLGSADLLDRELSALVSAASSST